MKQIMAKRDFYMEGHYFRRGETFTVDEEFDHQYADTLASGIKSNEDLLRERLRVSGIDQNVMQTRWAKDRAFTAAQKLEILEDVIAQRGKSDITQRQRKKQGENDKISGA